MGFGGGTGVGGTAQPPQIREQETQAFTENTKKYILAMLPPDTLEVIPFSQARYDETFKYKTEARTPLLHPLLFLRAGELPAIVKEEIWLPLYDELLNSLPEEMHRWLENELKKPPEQRDADAQSFNDFLILTAKGISWLEKAASPIEPNSGAEARYLAYLALPFIALRTVIDTGRKIAESAALFLESLGPNYPSYDALRSFVSLFKEFGEELNRLRIAVEEGKDPREIKREMSLLSARILSALQSFAKEKRSGDLQIMEQALQTLFILSASFGLSRGSPSLLLALSIAAIGLSNDKGFSAVVNGSYDTIIDALIDGLLSTITLGPQAEIAELNDLIDQLNGLRYAEGVL